MVPKIILVGRSGQIPLDPTPMLFMTSWAPTICLTPLTPDSEPCVGPVTLVLERAGCCGGIAVVMAALHHKRAHTLFFRKRKGAKAFGSLESRHVSNRMKMHSF